jgi:hypothetical protein
MSRAILWLMSGTTALAAICPVGCSHAAKPNVARENSAPAVSPQEPQYRDVLDVQVTLPNGKFQWWINEAVPVSAHVTDTLQRNDGSGWVKDTSDAIAIPAVVNVNWYVNVGSFTDPDSAVTTWIGSDYEDNTDGERITIGALATELSPCVLKDSSSASPSTWPSDPPADARVASEPQSTTTAANFDAELKATEGNRNRDDRIRHFRNALRLRPGDPQNIVLEFDIGVELGQRYDPAHHVFPKEREALAVFEEIVRRYDHKTYYRQTPEGTSESPELMVPRAAILAASTLTGLLQQNENARQYLMVAMKDLIWTYQKRRWDWANEPAPVRPPPLFVLLDAPDDGRFDRQMKWWQATTRAAARNDVSIAEPYGPELVEAAMREYRLSYGSQKPADVAAAMQPIADLFKDTPLAKLAKQQIECGQQR